MAAMEAYGNIWLLRHDGATPGVFERIANVKAFNGPDEETAFNDATDFDSPGGKREWRPGLTDGGGLDMTMNYKPGAPTWAKLKAQRKAKKKALFRLITCDAEEGTRECEEFEAFVQTLGRSAEVDGLMEGRCALKIDGDTNDTAPAYPTIAVAWSPPTVIEGGSPAVSVATITLSHADGKGTEIGLAWTGTGTVGDDYTRPAATSVVIPAGETSVTIGPVTVLGTATISGTETVILTIDPEIDGHTLTATPGGALAATLTLDDGV